MDLINHMKQYDRYLQLKSDPHTYDLPMVSSPPSTMLTLSMVFIPLYLYAYRLLKEIKSTELKPYQIVYYGLLFGVYGIAVPLSLVLTDGGSIMFSCNLDSAITLLSLARVYASYVYFLLRLSGFIDLLLMLAGGNAHLITTGLLLETFIIPITVYGQLKYYPGGASIFYLGLDSFFSCIRYGILTKSSSYLKSSIDYQEYLNLLKIGQYVLALMHSIYIFNIDCNCSPILLMGVVAANCVILVGYLNSPFKLTPVVNSVGKIASKKMVTKKSS